MNENIIYKSQTLKYLMCMQNQIFFSMTLCSHKICIYGLKQAVSHLQMLITFRVLVVMQSSRFRPHLKTSRDSSILSLLCFGLASKVGVCVLILSRITCILVLSQILDLVQVSSRIFAFSRTSGKNVQSRWNYHVATLCQAWIFFYVPL